MFGETDVTTVTTGASHVSDLRKETQGLDSVSFLQDWSRLDAHVNTTPTPTVGSGDKDRPSKELDRAELEQ